MLMSPKLAELRQHPNNPQTPGQQTTDAKTVHIFSNYKRWNQEFLKPNLGKLGEFDCMKTSDP